MTTTLNASKLKLLSSNYADGDKTDDNESIMTEDFVNKFNEMFVPKEDSGISSVRSQTRLGSGASKKARPYESESHIRASTRPSTYKSLPTSRVSNPHGTDGLDGDSIMTEDFESNFRQLLFRGPNPAQDSSVIDSSDVATARSNRLRERVGNLFNVPATRVKLNEDSHSDTETDYVDKKFQEIIERRRKEVSHPRSQSIPASPKLSNLRRSTPVPFQPPYRATSPERVTPFSVRRETKESPAVTKSHSDDFHDDEYRAEIRLNSLRIKRELEQERRDRMPSPKRESPTETQRKLNTGMTPRETLDRKVVELDAMTDNVKRARGEREVLISDLRDMQDTLRKNAAEVRFTEKWMRENRAKAEDVRTELMMAEMRRTTTMKEVNRLNEECLRKRSEIIDLEDKLRQRVREIQEMESQGINRDELEAVIAERNELLQIIRANEESEYQKYELEKQLSIAKEDLVSEQQKNREKHIILEEELEASMSKITDLRRDKESMKLENMNLTEKINRLERDISNTEQEKQRIRTDFEELGKSRHLTRFSLSSSILKEYFQNKAEEFEHVKSRLQSDLDEIRMKQTREESQLQRDVRSLNESNTRLQRECEAATEAAEEFRQQIIQLTQDLATANESRGLLLEEAERKINQLEAEKSKEVKRAREAVMAEESDKIASLQAQMEHEKHLSLQSIENQFHRQLEDLKIQIKLREDEIDYLKDRLRRHDSDMKKLEEEMQMESRAKLRETVSRERQNWEKAEENKWRRQINEAKEEAKRSVETLEANVARQRETIQAQDLQISDLRKALDEEQNRLKQLTKERQVAVNRAKELAEEEKVREIEKLKDRLARETEAELGRLRVQVQNHKEHLDMVRRDKESQLKHEEELQGIAERIERTVVHEVNEECKKMAEILGIKPRSVDISEFASSSTGSKSSNPITAALANMEACGEEMRSLVLELRISNDELRTKMDNFKKENDSELETIRRQLQTEKTKEIVLRGHRIRVEHSTELSRLENLLREREEELRNLKRGMQKWKSGTAEQIASNIQAEFNRVGQRKIKDLQASLLDRERDIQRLQSEMNKSAALGRSTPDPNAARLIGHLQEQVKHLRKENLLLHKRGLSRHSGSTGDLTNGHNGDLSIPNRPASRNTLSRKIVSNV